MTYVAGIDGGQSSTAAVVLDAGGRLVGRGLAGPADHADEPAGSTRCAEACTAALAAALADAGLEPATRLAAVHIGLSGFDDQWDGVCPVLPARVVRMQHDAPIALAGAVGIRPAVVVIAGTGSVAYGEAPDGRAVRIGGWGGLFGDEGSAFAVARDALALAMRAADRGETTALGEAAVAFFDHRNLRELASLAVQGRISRAALASFSRVVHDAARLGDPDARRIVDHAAAALVGLAALAVERLGVSDRPVPIALVGGAFLNDAFAAQVRAGLADLVPVGVPMRPRHEPAVGAALLAFADAGLPVPEPVTLRQAQNDRA